MKTGLTKKQKRTSIYFTEAYKFVEICTYNTELKNRLAAFAEKYPTECRQLDDDENGCQTYEIRKGRFGFKLTPPYSQERKRSASRLAKKNIENLRRGYKMKLLSCVFNIDTACVELKFDNGSTIAIDTIAVENEVADNMYQRSELDYLIYNAPLEYADLILNGDPETYLKTVTEYKPLDS